MNTTTLAEVKLVRNLVSFFNILIVYPVRITTGTYSKEVKT